MGNRNDPPWLQTRHNDPPAWLHKVAVAVRRHPVMAAFTVMVLVIGVPVGNIVVQQAQIRAQNHRISESRVSVTTAVCRALNDQALSSNGANLYLQGLLIGGAKQSRPFEPIYRRLGLPSYQDRLDQAERAAGSLGELAVPHIACDRLDAQVRANRQVNKIPYDGPQFPPVPGYPTLPTR